MLEDALDVSIRYGALQESTLVARKLAASPRVLVASPSYLERAGTPTTPQDLATHRLLTLQLGNTPERSWTLGATGSNTIVPLESTMCGDGLLVRRWAVAGHGIAFKSLFDVIDDLEAGRLVRVLPVVDLAAGAIHAVFPSKTFVPARVRGLVEHLAAGFAAREARCDAWLAS